MSEHKLEGRVRRGGEDILTNREIVEVGPAPEACGGRRYETRRELVNDVLCSNKYGQKVRKSVYFLMTEIYLCILNNSLYILSVHFPNQTPNNPIYILTELRSYPTQQRCPSNHNIIIAIINRF